MIGSAALISERDRSLAQIGSERDRLQTALDEIRQQRAELEGSLEEERGKHAAAVQELSERSSMLAEGETRSEELSARIRELETAAQRSAADEVHHHLHERGLSGAVRADEPHDEAPGNPERHALQLEVPVALADAVKLDHCLHHSASRYSSSSMRASSSGPIRSSRGVDRWPGRGRVCRRISGWKGRRC